MKKYRITCSHCSLKISMLLSTRPSKCPSCKEYFAYHDVNDNCDTFTGIQLSDVFASGGNTYIQAEGDCSIKTENDVILNTDTVVKAIKGASVEMDNPVVDSAPNLPKSTNFKGFEISPHKVYILNKIVISVIGLEQTLLMNGNELKEFFKIVQNRIYNGLVEGLNGGALTGIREIYSDDFQSVEIINLDRGLTSEGVELLKFIANDLNGEND